MLAVSQPLQIFQGGTDVNEFWINFLANLAADALLAVAVYLIVTQPGEKRKSKQRQIHALGLLKSEAQINQARAESYIASLANPASIETTIFPLRYTRGAWNALRESGFISELEDPRLVYYLFRMNEIGLIANKNLRRLELAHLEKTGGKIIELAELSRKNSEQFLSALSRVLDGMQGIEVVTIEPPELSLGEPVVDDEEEMAG